MGTVGQTHGDWLVTYELARQHRRAATPDHEPWTLEQLVDGFWLTDEHIICRPNQGRYFVPASRIILIERRS